jgi:dihydrodipicolinate synthase/N-acetylneuraminate lyase
MSQLLSLDVLVTKLAANKILVVSAHPVIIKADEFALAKGVEALREVAGLPMISYAVPVSFYLTLNANN